MAGTQEQLDPYATPGWRDSFALNVFGWKGVVALGLALLVMVGAAGYGWMTNSAPVSVDQALDRFRRSSPQSGASARGKPVRSKRTQVGKRKKAVERESKRAKKAPDEQAPTVVVAAPEQARPNEEGRVRPHEAARNRGGSAYAASAPREGVYSWDTDGWESAGGARRSFPEESQRIVNHENGGWFQHHYFSNQREIWTRFRRLDDGAAIAMQRNKVTFGPITNDSTIDFAPPMLVGPKELKVGQTWSGRWSGKTSGSYEGETFERIRLNIGGTQVEAWGIRVLMEMRGEIEGSVEARVWLAPKYALTVREHYKQNVKADVGDYRAEWTMTLKSLEPRT